MEHGAPVEKCVCVCDFLLFITHARCVVNLHDDSGVVHKLGRQFLWDFELTLPLRRQSVVRTFIFKVMDLRQSLTTSSSSLNYARGLWTTTL